MPTITPNQTFKHGANTYQEGQNYEVSNDEACYFQEVGWIGDKLLGKDAALDVHDIQLGHGTEVN